MEGILQLPYVQNLIQQYGVNKALELLGLDQEENNPLIFGMPFTNKKINLLPTLARGGINAVFKGGLSGLGKAALPVAAVGGLYYLSQRYNPLNPNAVNYNPYLGDELDYLSSNNLIGKNIGPGQGFTRYGPDSVLYGKNVMSLAGSNSYIDMLDKYIANMEANEKISAAGKARKLKKARDERAAYNLAEVNRELKKEEEERNKKLTNKMTTYQGAGDGASQANKGSSVGYTTADDRRESFRGRYGQGGLASLA